MNDINKLIKEIEELKLKNKQLEDKLKTYTSNHRHKKYYIENVIVKYRYLIESIYQ
jgi:cell division septum initiation protein DivIVA